MSNQLMIPPAVSTAVQPKPTKTELIEALTIRKHAQLTEQAKIDTAAVAAADQAVKDAIKTYFADAMDGFSGEYTNASIYNGRFSIEARFRCDNPPTHIRKLMERENTLRKNRVWVPQMSDVRKSVRESLSNATPKSERISTLLNDAKSSKQLDAMLSALFGKQPASIAV